MVPAAMDSVNKILVRLCSIWFFSQTSKSPKLKKKHGAVSHHGTCQAIADSMILHYFEGRYSDFYHRYFDKVVFATTRTTIAVWLGMMHGEYSCSKVKPLFPNKSEASTIMEFLRPMLVVHMSRELSHWRCQGNNFVGKIKIASGSFRVRHLVVLE